MNQRAPHAFAGVTLYEYWKDGFLPAGQKAPSIAAQNRQTNEKIRPKVAKNFSKIGVDCQGTVHGYRLRNLVAQAMYGSGSISGVQS